MKYFLDMQNVFILQFSVNGCYFCVLSFVADKSWFNITSRLDTKFMIFLFYFQDNVSSMTSIMITERATSRTRASTAFARSVQNVAHTERHQRLFLNEMCYIDTAICYG